MLHVDIELIDVPIVDVIRVTGHALRGDLAGDIQEGIGILEQRDDVSDRIDVGFTELERSSSLCSGESVDGL